MTTLRHFYLDIDDRLGDWNWKIFTFRIERMIEQAGKQSKRTDSKQEKLMADAPCKNCKLRAKYDQNPSSLIGRFWRWHINFCPGWKAYFTGLPQEEKKRLAAQYDFRKYQ